MGSCLPVILLLKLDFKTILSTTYVYVKLFNAGPLPLKLIVNDILIIFKVI